jgi:hypothetical protein
MWIPPVLIAMPVVPMLLEFSAVRLIKAQSHDNPKNPQNFKLVLRPFPFVQQPPLVSMNPGDHLLHSLEWYRVVKSSLNPSMGQFPIVVSIAKNLLGQPAIS